METAEQLKRQIESAQNLRDLVGTMKMLAVTNIRRYQEAVDALGNYFGVIEQGLQIALSKTRAAPTTWELPAAKEEHDLAVVLFGSDQGLCGRFNEQIVDHFQETLRYTFNGQKPARVLCIGMRPALLLGNAGFHVDREFAVPGCPTGVTRVIQEIVFTVEEWVSTENIQKVHIFHNELIRGSFYRPNDLKLLPLDADWFTRYEEKEWPNKRVIPTFTMDAEELVSSLVLQYFFFSLYRSAVESLASENAARLMSMQAAEKNIEERLEELKMTANQVRQNSITAELLDIVGGYEALGGNKMKLPEPEGGACRLPAG